VLPWHTVPVVCFGLPLAPSLALICRFVCSQPAPV
jgi:hypothetical protein